MARLEIPLIGLIVEHFKHQPDVPMELVPDDVYYSELERRNNPPQAGSAQRPTGLPTGPLDEPKLESHIRQNETRMEHRDSLHRGFSRNNYKVR